MLPVRSTAQPGLTIRLDVADRLPAVEADGAHIERVMLREDEAAGPPGG